MAENTKNPLEGEENTEGQEPTQEQPQSARERFMARHRERHPDMDVDDEEAFYGSLNDDYDGYENDINGYKEREQGIVDMFESDPRSANFFTNWRKGENPIVQLIRIFGPELKDALEDPENMDAIENAYKEYTDGLAKMKVAKEEQEKNIQESFANLDQMAKERGLSEEEVQNGMAKLFAIVKDAMQGIYTPDTLATILDAINHDKDVETAAHDAEIAGRNAKIQEQLRRPSGDGTPQLAGANNVREPQRKRNSIFDLAAQAS